MLSNSNVFILLILIKHSALFETTLANSVAVNAHAQSFDDTEFRTIETVTTTTATITTSLSHVGHRHSIEEDGKHSAPPSEYHTQLFTKDIKESNARTTASPTTTTTTTKDPLVAGNRKQFQITVEDGQNVDNDGDEDVNVDLVTNHKIARANRRPSTIDHVKKLIDDDFSTERQSSVGSDEWNNVSSTVEMVSSTFASSSSLTHSKNQIHDSLTTNNATISNNNNNNNSAHHNNQKSNLHGNRRPHSNKGYSARSALIGNSVNTNTNSNNNDNNDNRNNNSNNNRIIDDNGSIKKSIDYVNDGHVNDDDDNTDYNVNSNSELPPIQLDAPSLPLSSSSGGNDPDTDLHQAELLKPRSDAVYFVVAVIGGARVWSRTLARTIHEMGPPFSGDPLGSPLRPIYIDLPTNGRFSVNVLLSLCQQSEKRPLAGVVVIGNGQSAHAVAHAGSAMQLPVLWAKGGTTNLHELQPEASLQALLQPSAIEIFEAVRSLFLQTHWHSFFVLSDVQGTNVMNVKDNPLKRAPLIPTIVSLPRNNEDVFKQLAQISRSTRGVILLLSNLQATKRIMTEAHRLNMVGGHFIWLWIDTSSSTGYFHQTTVPIRQHSKSSQHRQPARKMSSTDSVSATATTATAITQNGTEPDGNRKMVDKTDTIISTVKTDTKSASSGKSASDKSKSKSSGGEHDADRSTKVDFSQGFDPFRVLQRQDEHLKQTFNLPQHYQERTTQRGDNKQTSTNRLILGLRGENAQTEPEEQHGRSKKTRRSNSGSSGSSNVKAVNSTAVHVKNVKAGNGTQNVKNDRNRHGMTEDTTKSISTKSVNHKNSSKNSSSSTTSKHTNISKTGNDDEMPIFISNHTNAAKSPIYSKYRNFSDDNLDDFIDNNNFNENHNLKLNSKRTSTANETISSSSYVSFHQFKDFPVGLLALRPIRMNVDRHFIRAAVRLFAATWEKINGSQTVVSAASMSSTPLSSSLQSSSSSLSSSSSSLSSGAVPSSVTLPQSRRVQPNRNAQATTTLYNAKKFGNEMHGRKMRRKRNIFTINQLLTVILEKRSIHASSSQSSSSSSDDTVAALKQVNSSLFLKEFSANSDIDKSNVKNLNSGIDANGWSNWPVSSSSNSSSINTDHIEPFMQFNSSFTSDLPNNENTNNNVNYANNSISLTNMNVSFNRNFSGLWKQNSKNKSNIHSLNNQRHQTITTATTTTETAATMPTTTSTAVTSASPITTSPATSSSGQMLTPFILSNVTNLATTPFNRNDLSTESMARQASQSIVRNFFGNNRSQDIRQPSNKRQNTSWSTRKESIAMQSKRPHNDANQLANVHHHNSGGSSGSGSGIHHHQQHHIDHDPTNNQIKCTTPSYFGGCYGTATAQDIKNAEYFLRALTEATKLALSGRPIYNGISETALTTNFELLNLVPSDHPYHSKINDNQAFTMQNQQQQQQQSKQHRKEKRSTTTTTNANVTNEVSTTKWRRVGLVSASSVRLDTIVWPGGDIVVSGLSAGARSVFRIVTALAPPFVMESELDEDGLCLRGLPCHRVSPVGRHNLTLMFNAIETRDRLEEDAVEHGNDLPPEPEHLDEKISHVTKCCYGLTMDLLDNIATELGFEFHLYVVRDQLFGSKQQRDFKDFMKGSGTKTALHSNNGIDGSGIGGGNTAATTSSTSQQQHHQKQQQQPPTDHDSNDETPSTDQWNGIIGDLVSGSADMSFAPLSVSKARAQAIDFSIPYFHSGVSLLASPKTKSEIPLLAFLLPFSPELWIAIFTSLNITAVAVAVYEWLSPFGLNPWGRQRSKNFSLSSALWVMWGLLCGHLVAFKAPKSWPNKFLINVWGGFSVIFVASYTANIAALIAGLFFHHAASSYDSSLTTQRVGAPIASAAEAYVQNKDKHLWEHMKKYTLNHIEDGIRGLKNGTLDLLMADSPILDYYRATDHGCSLQRIGDTFVEDTYAIGMVKGFPLKESISALIAKYSSNGYLDILTEKWYGGLPCFKYEAEIVTPRPLGVAAVAGVFLLLGLGMVMGVVILIFEHWFYKYALPSLRLKPKGTIWKSRNIMFFSQKLYRFINCVELVSPHHAARELVHSIRQGQIASLFQKSIKRKEDEQRRRRKSKAQFFEMIQEIRRAQQVERQNLASVAEAEPQKDNVKSPPSLFKPRASPKPGIFSALKKDGRSRSNSSVLTPRRFSTDSILGDRMDSIGRRLSRDLTNSPPDLNKRYECGTKNDVSPQKFDTISGSNLAALGISKSNETLSNRYDTFSGKNVDKHVGIPAIKLKKGKRPKISFESYHRDRSDTSGDKDDCDYELPSVKEGLEPTVVQQDRSVAILRHQLHEELLSKHPPVQGKPTVSISVPNSIERPPLPKRIVKHQRQKSLDNLDVDDGIGKTKVSPYRSDSSAGSLTKVNQRSQISLERLSREDLLRLSHSSQSEIHEYLKGSPMPDRAAEPP